MRRAFLSCSLPQVPLGGRSLSPIALKIKFGLHTAHRHLMLAPQLRPTGRSQHSHGKSLTKMGVLMGKSSINGPSIPWRCLFLKMPIKKTHRCIAQQIRDIRTSLSWAPSVMAMTGCIKRPPFGGILRRAWGKSNHVAITFNVYL